MHINLTIEENENGETEELEVPAKHEVCHDCEGHGMVMNESMRHHAYSQEEFEETFWDDEDRAEYFKRGGIYDVECPTCKGKRVLQVPNPEMMSKKELDFYNRWQDIENDRIAFEQENAREIYYERMMGY